MSWGFDKNLREMWPDIKHNRPGKFDWKGLAGTVLEQEAVETLEFCRIALAEDTFPREDYKELVQLILVWLCGVKEVAGFKFQWPGG